MQVEGNYLHPVKVLRGVSLQRHAAWGEEVQQVDEGRLGHDVTCTQLRQSRPAVHRVHDGLEHPQLACSDNTGIAGVEYLYLSAESKS